MTSLRKIALLLLLATVGVVHPVSGEPIHVVAVGDLLLGGSAADRVRRSGFDYPFAATADTIRRADIALANLEAPLTDAGEAIPGKTFTFRVPPAAAGAISSAGFDLLTLANNHLGDYGRQGVLDTLDTLEKAGLGVTGAGRTLADARRPFLVDVNGERLAFLAYSNTFPTSFYATKDRPGTAPGHFDAVAADIRRARAAADYVIVSFHWGSERMTEPKDYQKELARLAIDSGAQVVIGHHPHVLQGAELYRDGVIYYSLGNYAFGSYSQSSVTGGLARIRLAGGRVEKAEILPLNVFNIEVQFQPKPLARGPAYAFARDFNAISGHLGTALLKQPDLFWGIEKIRGANDGTSETEAGRPLFGRQGSGDARTSERNL